MNPPVATQATIAYDPAEPSRPAPQNLQVRLAQGASAPSDIQALLRFRLRVAATLTAIVYLSFVHGWVSNGAYRFSEFSFANWLDLFLVHGTLAAELLASAVLWSPLVLSLPRLRFIEEVVLAFPVFQIAWYDIEPPFNRNLFEVSFSSAHGYEDAARVRVFPWFVVIIAYGVLIPNTWRRSAVVLSSVAVLALGIQAAAATWHGQIGQQKVQGYLIDMAVWLVFATAVAVFNAYRIDVLRADSSTARKLGQYLLREKLGSGGMGEVYRAEHALLRRPCAVKLVRPDRAADPATLARFEREVQATAALAHPHIVRIHDYGRADDGTFYCVMELLPGATLDALVARHGPLPPARAVFLLRQLCSALAEAHAIGLIHRDVKPGNVIVRDAGRQADAATLLDFGLVLDRIAGDEKLTREGAVAGTPAFMAPEHAAGDPVDARADVYAVGAVGYFLLSGRPPFAAGSAMRTIAAVLTEAPKPLDGAPAELAAVIARCLAKSPADRFPSADELDAALARGAGDSWSHQHAADWWKERRTNRPRSGPENGTHTPPDGQAGPTGTFAPGPA
jgi:serine/threonine-protein kinase